MNSYLTQSAAYEIFSAKLSQINFAAVTRQVAQTENWATQQLEQAIERYQQFLFLVQQYPEQGLVPDRETDAVLHAHLATEHFTQDCQILFGSELVHENGFGTRGEADRRSWLEVFSYTKRLIQQHLGWTNLDTLQPAHCITDVPLQGGITEQGQHPRSEIVAMS